MKNIFGLLAVLLGTFLLIGVVRYAVSGESGLTLPVWFETEKKASPSSTIALSLFEAYAFDQLKKKQINGGSVSLGRVLEEDEETVARAYYYEAAGKRVSGRLTLPKRAGIFPTVVMLRGYAEKDYYYLGSGTSRAARAFAGEGFAAISTDFLGFGESDDDDQDILLNRFRRPETVLYLLASLDEVDRQLAQAGSTARLDLENLFFWGHSNGGQIALSVLEITGQSIPTTLWAPVSKPFPESVLQFASEMTDEGKVVIEAISAFQARHDCTRYSITNYWDWITAPVQVQQGTADLSVSLADSQRLVAQLEAAGVRARLLTYQGADHNLKQAWEEAIGMDVAFFRTHL